LFLCIPKNKILNIKKVLVKPIENLEKKLYTEFGCGRDFFLAQDVEKMHREII